MDPGQLETERLLKRIEADVIDFYSVARKEVEFKFNEFNRKTKIKEVVKRKQLKAGEITQAQFDDWLAGQIIAGERWKEQLNVLSTDLLNAHNIAQSMVNGYLPEAFAVGHNYGLYQVEKGLNMTTTFSLYDRATVQRIIKENPQLLPKLKPLSKTAQEIRDGKIKKWAKRQIQSTCLQGILQGQSIPEISNRISAITLQEAKSTIRYARTMVTGAENAGRIDSYKQAESMGIEVEQQWLATLDNRTREEHREMDGEHVKIGEAFSNGCRYPGDPEGDPASIWNCRCTLLPMLIGVDGLNNDLSDISRRESSKIAGMTYADWKKAKPKYEPIEKQKKIGEAYKWQFIKQYKDAAERLQRVKI